MSCTQPSPLGLSPLLPLHIFFLSNTTTPFSPSPLSPLALSGLFLSPFGKHKPTTLTYFRVVPGKLYSPNKHAEADYRHAGSKTIKIERKK